MSDHPKRTTSGQFAKGQSGNPAGAAARKPKPILTPHDINLLILDIATRETQLRTDRGFETVNMIERNALALASGNKVGTAPGAFIALAKAAAWGVQRHREREEEEARIAAQREAQR
ncbi:hypothetical protein F4693_000733 [Sphingomonas endophytica]|uniref:DUF5681 domain-containing protein n=1 Tax=Sphingomonas endophytica TaxID=869719 RepID=A0A7X0MNS5_9SPHN|nr:DUF5681 domain-containing protein [Sphingomonas endophytica]MBB6503778.1 hypothetical protein [Sphingomonas endophytica]